MARRPRARTGPQTLQQSIGKAKPQCLESAWLGIYPAALTYCRIRRQIGRNHYRGWGARTLASGRQSLSPSLCGRTAGTISMSAGKTDRDECLLDYLDTATGAGSFA